MRRGCKEWATKDGSAIGAWVFKANPDLFDALNDLSEFGEIRAWSVQPSYRIDMFEAGQPALLWITAGKSRAVEAGFYAFGEVTKGGYFHDSWTDDNGDTHHDVFVTVRLRPLLTPILKADVLKHDSLHQVEPINSPQLANPMVLHEQEYAEALAHFDLSTKSPTAEQLEALTAAEERRNELQPLLMIYSAGDTAVTVFVGEFEDTQMPIVVLQPDPEATEGLRHTHFEHIDAFWKVNAETVDALVDAAPAVSDASIEEDAVWDALLAAVSPGEDPLLIVKTVHNEFRLLDPIERQEDGSFGDRRTFGSLPDAVDAAIDIVIPEDQAGADDIN